MSYLVERQQDIVIRKDTNTVKYEATVEQDNIIQGIIFGVPVVIIFVGILVFYLGSHWGRFQMGSLSLLGN